MYAVAFSVGSSEVIMPVFFCKLKFIEHGYFKNSEL